MALTLGDNFSYQGQKPLDGRIKYDTVAAMKAVADATMYNGCLAYCEATDKTYQWKSTNTVDETLGKWREFETGGGTEYTAGDNIDITNGVISATDTTYTAGDGIEIDENNEISLTQSESGDIDEIVDLPPTTPTDMGEIVNPVPTPAMIPVHYSEDEQVIGTWIDGSSLYQKTVEITNIPNNNMTDTAHNISNFGVLVSIEGVILVPAKNNGTSLPRVMDNSTTTDIGVDVTPSIVRLKARQFDASATYSIAYITIKYTKTTS